MPRVFISHSWDDNDVSRKLAEYLKRDGLDIWIDYLGIKPGESFLTRIGNALEWCDTLVLVWSAKAESSWHVKLEWENALNIHKRIIPCKLDDTTMPTLLTNLLYIRFYNFDEGYADLLSAMRPIKTTSHEPIHHRNKKCPLCASTMTFDSFYDSWQGDSDGPFPRYINVYKCPGCQSIKED